MNAAKANGDADVDETARGRGDHDADDPDDSAGGDDEQRAGRPRLVQAAAAGHAEPSCSTESVGSSWSKVRACGSTGPRSAGGANSGVVSGAQPFASIAVDHRLDHRRVELAAGAAAQLDEGLLDRACAAVGPGGGHRVERVSDRDDPGELRDLLAREPHRVAEPVEALVVVHDPRDRLVEELDLADDLQALHRVALDRRELALGQPSVLLQHPRRHAELADVVQHPGIAQRGHPVLAHADRRAR